MVIEDRQINLLWQKIFNDLPSQYWPSSTLYVVATPIGNLADMSARALYCLQLVDRIACEDTRSSKALLNSWGIDTPLMAAHQHNEMQAAQQIIQGLAQGERIALISDAGAPAVSDPGGRLVREVRAAGYEVRPLPGPSAVITALMGSGVTSDENPAFCFAGFVPSKSTASQNWLKQWGQHEMPIVMFESPHRLLSSVEDMLSVFGAERQLTVARELSKRFEQIVSLPLGQVRAWLDADEHRQKGEFVLILAAKPEESRDAAEQSLDNYLFTMLRLISLKDSVKLAVQFTGLSRDTVYARALEIKQALEE